jgi:hypothetical protein
VVLGAHAFNARGISDATWCARGRVNVVRGIVADAAIDPLLKRISFRIFREKK